MVWPAPARRRCGLSSRTELSRERERIFSSESESVAPARGTRGQSARGGLSLDSSSVRGRATSTLENIAFCRTEAQSTDQAARAESGLIGSAGSPISRSSAASADASYGASVPGAWPPTDSAPQPSPSARVGASTSISSASMDVGEGLATASVPTCSSRMTEGATLRSPSTEAAGSAPVAKAAAERRLESDWPSSSAVCLSSREKPTHDPDASQ